MTAENNFSKIFKNFSKFNFEVYRYKSSGIICDLKKTAKAVSKLQNFDILAFFGVKVTKSKLTLKHVDSLYVILLSFY